MKKAPEAFRTISEVAEILGTPAHVLRFWESKFPQVRPLKRGGGRRYYRPEDIDLLREIRALLYDEGYTIAGANETLNKRSKNPHGAAAVAQLVETLQQARAAVIELIELVDERKAPRKAPGTAH